MKSFKRLSIDPLTVYGTLCVKCPLGDPSLAEESAGVISPGQGGRGDRDRGATHRGGDGRRGAGGAERPRHPARPTAGAASSARFSSSRRTIDALYVPNIDESLDEQDSKRAFWAAFRALGEWYEAQPPY